MLSRLKALAEAAFPNASLYPIRRLSKEYQNLFRDQRKVPVTLIRTFAEISGSMLSMSTLWFSTAFREYAYGFALNELEDDSEESDPLTAAIAVHAILFFAGFGLGSVAAKQMLRLYHYMRYNVTNSDYIKLSEKEIKSLTELWFISPEVSVAIFKYLTQKIQEAKEKARKDNGITSPHQQTIVSTKLALQTLRKAAKIPDKMDETLALISLGEYFEQEITRSTTRIRVLQSQIDHINNIAANIRTSKTEEAMGVDHQHAKSSMDEFDLTSIRVDDNKNNPEPFPVEELPSIAKTPTNEASPEAAQQKKVTLNRTVSFWLEKAGLQNADHKLSSGELREVRSYKDAAIRFIQTAINEQEETKTNINIFLTHLYR